jgi:SpoVK/Ycf46/Vps4 family AAA+-type ATPase
VRVAQQSGHDAIPSEARLGVYHVTQRLLRSNPQALVLFDECEDVFPVDVFPMFGMRRKSGSLKGFTNRALEQNPVPAIWVTNEIDQMDPAFMRRFTCHLEVPRPTRTVRRRILTKYFAELPVDQAFLERMSASDTLTPADIETAARFAAVSGDADPVAGRAPDGTSGAPSGRRDLSDTLERMLRNRLSARGDSLALPAMHADTTGYRLEYLNADANLEQLAVSLGKKPAGTMLLYGPPGTGKTAFGRHLADRIGRPLQIHRASDLISAWVGESEKAIARMFKQARAERAVLLLDEADSYLQDRRKAHHSWEVTQVNEMLTQMEEFDGLFICSTNLADDLDQASFRRFGMKVQFSYLKPEQAWAMFTADLLRRGQALDPTSEETPALWTAIRRLETLTPGDFATVGRKLAILDRAVTPQEYVGLLEDECRTKKDGDKRKAVGF